MSPRKTRPRAPAPPDRQALEALKAESTLQLLFKAARLLDEAAVRRVSALEGAPRLRRSHTALLPHIDMNGTRISELAERLGISKQAVSELLDDLEAAGVVKRAPDPDDARAKRVTFTPRGLAAMAHGLGILKELERELALAVGAAKVRELHGTLARILAHLESVPGSSPSC